jgi:hypothetical protein
MHANDLTAPLGQGARESRRVNKRLVVKIAAVALGLFLGVFVLWAVAVRDLSGGGERVAAAPADLHLANKGPEPLPVSQAPATAESGKSATPAPAPGESAPAPAKPPNTVTVTIVDGKTGAQRQVVVAAPASPASSADATPPDQNNAEIIGATPKPVNAPKLRKTQ